MKKTQVFSIKPHKATVKMGVEDAVLGWEQLKGSIEKIYAQQSSELSYEAVYRLAYNLTLYKHGELLYKGVFAVVRDWLRRELRGIRPTDGATLLPATKRLYDAHKMYMGMIRDILLYTDRTYVATNRKRPVFDEGLETFRVVVIEGEAGAGGGGGGGGGAGAGAASSSLGVTTTTHGAGSGSSSSAASQAGGPVHGLGGAIKDTLLAAFKEARDARGPLDGGTVRHVTRMLVELGQPNPAAPPPYPTYFERPFLEATASYYAAESAAAVAELAAPDYLRYAEGRLLYEQEAVRPLLDEGTAAQLRGLLQRELLANHAVALIEMDTGLPRMLTSYESDAMASAAAASAAGGAGHVGAGPVGSGAAASSATAGGIGAAAAAASSGAGAGSSSSSASAGAKALGDLRRMYQLFLDVKTTVTWRGPGGGGAGAGASSGAASGVSARVRVVPPILLLRDVIKAHVVDRGCAIVVDPESKKNPVSFVQSLLDLRDRFSALVDDAFGGDKEFHRALKEAFEAVMNNPDLGRLAGGGSGADDRPSSSSSAVSPNVCAEYLSVYVDEHMKGGFKGLTEGEVEDRLDKVIVLFRFLHDKDVFEAHYKAHLQKRLLGGRSGADNDAERAMLAKLKQECGFTYTSKLEGMFNDLRTSEEFMRAYRAERVAHPPAPVMVPAPGAGVGAASSSATALVPVAPVELDVQVLTTGYWPVLADAPVRLPPEVAAAADHFRAFYLSKHTGRRLAWLSSKGSAEVRARFPNGKAHELTVSTYQVAVLLAFNAAGADTLSLAQLRAAVGLGDDDELRRHVLSLTAPKARVLVRSGKARDLEDGETLTVNPAFDSKLVKVKVPLISLKSIQTATAGAQGGSAGGAGAGSGAGGGGDGSGDVSEEVAEARKHMLEAAIVRVMKARKSMDHNALLGEVLKQVQLRFAAQPGDVKKRIEALIERDYLERDNDSRNIYHYLA